jgi:hypothetical protein
VILGKNEHTSRMLTTGEKQLPSHDGQMNIHVITKLNFWYPFSWPSVPPPPKCIVTIRNFGVHYHQLEIRTPNDVEIQWNFTSSRSKKDNLKVATVRYCHSLAKIFLFILIWLTVAIFFITENIRSFTTDHINDY